MQVGLTSNTISDLDLSKIAFFPIRPRLLQVPGVANVAMWGETKKEIEVPADPARCSREGSLGAAAGRGRQRGRQRTADVHDRRRDRHRRLDRDRQPAARDPQRAGDQNAAGARERARSRARSTDADTRRRRSCQLRHLAADRDRRRQRRARDDARDREVPGRQHTRRHERDPQGVRGAAARAPGIQINTHIFRQASFIHTAIHNLSFAVVLGCILVVFVLIAFLFQWRAAFVSLLAIPLSLGAAAIVLDAEGTTINTMILAGFGVAVGVVVDDAIIDMENIVRRLRNWRAPGRRTTPLHLLLAASLEVRRRSCTRP